MNEIDGGRRRWRRGHRRFERCGTNERACSKRLQDINTLPRNFRNPSHFKAEVNTHYSLLDLFDNVIYCKRVNNVICT